MRKNTLNFLIDLISLVVMLGMVATGSVIRYILPPGTGGRNVGEGAAQGRQLVLWGMGRHDWGDIHFWLAISVVVLMIIHVALHWTWVCNTIRQMLQIKPGQAPNKNYQYGVIFLTLLVILSGVFFWLAKNNVLSAAGLSNTDRQTDNQIAAEYNEDQQNEETHQPGNHLIQGAMTLREIEGLTGVSVDLLCRELGIPGGVSADERLGRLKRQYGFEMEQVREIVAKYRSK